MGEQPEDSEESREIPNREDRERIGRGEKQQEQHRYAFSAARQTRPSCALNQTGDNTRSPIRRQKHINILPRDREDKLR
jgi:hypothetical protein